MASLNEKTELAAALFNRGVERFERRVYGVAQSASSAGTVTVDIGGETVTVPTIGAVSTGDTVAILVQDGHPVCLGPAGWGDSIAETLSYVWLDQYGQLRVTPIPQDQNPTTGVTVKSAGVDVISNDYTSSLTDSGLTISSNTDGQVARLDTFNWNSGAVLTGRNGLWLSAKGGDFDNNLIEPVEVYLRSSVQSGVSIVQLQSSGIVLAAIYSDSIQYGGPTSAKVYPVASASNLGPVKVGSGLAIAADGTLSEYDSGWTNVVNGGAIKARVVGKMMTVKAIGYTTSTASGWVTVGTLPESVTQTMRFLVCKYSDGTTRRGEIDGNSLKLHQPGSAIGVEFTVTVPIG